MSVSSAAATFQIHCDGRIASWPDTARDLFGRSAADVVGQPLAAFIEPRQREACENVVSHLCREGRPGAVHTMDMLAVRPDGSTFPLECSLWRCPSDTSRFDVLVRDVSHRLHLEEDLRRQLRELRRFSASQIQELERTQSRFKDIAETIDEVFWMADAAITRTLYVSPAYQRIWGRSCESLYNEPRSFLETIHPDDRQRIVDNLLCQRDGLPFDHEYRILRPDGTVLWIWDRGFPVRNPDGSIDRYIGVAQDITARRHSEAALRRQETLDAIGHMTGGLAHDFNNVLAVVIGHLDLIAIAASDDSARENTDRALDAALRGSRLAKRLLALARREPAARRVIDLADAVDGLGPLLQHAVGVDVSLSVLTVMHPRVTLDPGELDAAMINLAVNARAAMPAGGSLTISVDEIDISGSTTELPMPAGRYASLVVEDTGVGMDDEVLRRIGEPFFTTRSEREGTGLGLSMVHAFVRQSGGVMRVESAPGEGSRFRILLPLSGAQLGDASTDEAVSTSPHDPLDRGTMRP